MTLFRLGARAQAAGYRLIARDVTGSTNADALHEAEAGDDGPLWVTALQQDAGRGRRGRAWATPYGNMAASLLMVPDLPGEVLATLGFVAGVALNEALNQIMPSMAVRIGVDGADSRGGGRIALKWPNDVLADGAKLAGILLESRRMPDGRQAIVIGFGVNVVAAPEGLPYPATSIRALGSSAGAADIHEALSDSWVGVYNLWNGGQGLKDVLSLWRHSAAGIGAAVAVNLTDRTMRGTFETIDDQGRLIVRLQDGSTVPVTAGDIHFGTTASVPGSD